MRVHGARGRLALFTITNMPIARFAAWLRRAGNYDAYMARLAGRPARTGEHCFGCTAGAGSSCGAAIA